MEWILIKYLEKFFKQILTFRSPFMISHCIDNM